MYRIMINKRMGRVLVTGKESDLELTNRGWKVVKEFDKWRDAYEYARKVANKFDYILEWYLEEEINSSRSVKEIEITG
ncbi:MAG: hypothetical protein B6V02_00210 [Thermoprotei archaeon ex4572_64]|nr:MAG: hypothetical protein B6V02_00210 [Thermoprotei archaeon ex4572_64]